MIATAVSPVFRIERAYDRGYASPGPSRLRNYLRSRRAQIEEQVADHGAPGWASMVWDIATPPIMWPGFVAPGPEVMDHRLSIDDRDQDYSLLLEVDLATERFPGPRWPAGVGSGWRRRYDVEMEEAPLTPGRPLAAVTVGARALLRPPELPARVLGDDDSLWQAAEASCECLVKDANAVVSPVLEALRSQDGKR